MKVKLKVLAGASGGKELAIPLPKCLIGRHPDCQLRLNSDAISRHHCVLYVRGGKLFVRDLKSRNGTVVNGQRIQTDCELEDGDELRIGPLIVAVNVDQEGQPRPPSAANGTPLSAVSLAWGTESLRDDDRIADWLDEADAMAEAQRRGAPDTKRLELKAAHQPELPQASQEQSAASPQANSAGRAEAASPTAVDKRRNGLRDPRRPPGKLPRPGEIRATDSSEAAAKMLKQFFGRRP